MRMLTSSRPQPTMQKANQMGGIQNWNTVRQDCQIRDGITPLLKQNEASDSAASALMHCKKQRRSPLRLDSSNVPAQGGGSASRQRNVCRCGAFALRRSSSAALHASARHRPCVTANVPWETTIRKHRHGQPCLENDVSLPEADAVGCPSGQCS